MSSQNITYSSRADMDLISAKVEQLRTKLNEIAHPARLLHLETLSLSQELDEFINEYIKLVGLFKKNPDC